MTDPKKLLHLSREELACGPVLYIRSAWHSGRRLVLSADEAEELCSDLPKLFPEYFTAHSTRDAAQDGAKAPPVADHGLTAARGQDEPCS